MSFVLLTSFGCTRQRDLYDISSPLLQIEGDWVPSLNIANMSNQATAMVYGPDEVNKQYFLESNSVKAKVSKGKYDVMIFNGLMFSEDETNLDNIYFRNTDSLDTFEAFGEEGHENKRLARVNGEFIISNEMELLTSRRASVEVMGENVYFLKYKNGKNGFDSYDDYVEDEIKVTAMPVSYLARVTVTLKNPEGAAVANGALRGFARSVLMGTRFPSHLEGTHQMRLNNMKYTDPDSNLYATIESPEFVTFGPPVDLPERTYEFELKIALRDGREVHEIFDVTPQILPVIDAMRVNLSEETVIPIRLTIPIALTIDLPEVDLDAGGIDIDQWDDDEIIQIPIRL